MAVSCPLSTSVNFLQPRHPPAMFSLPPPAVLPTPAALLNLPAAYGYYTQNYTGEAHQSTSVDQRYDVQLSTGQCGVQLPDDRSGVQIPDGASSAQLPELQLPALQPDIQLSSFLPRDFPTYDLQGPPRPYPVPKRTSTLEGTSSDAGRPSTPRIDFSRMSSLTVTAVTTPQTEAVTPAEEDIPQVDLSSDDVMEDAETIDQNSTHDQNYDL